MKVGTLVKKYRLRLPQFKTMTAFARVIGVSVEHVRRIERNESLPSGNLMEKIVATLELTDAKQRYLWLSLATGQLDKTTAKNVVSLRAQNYESLAEAAVEVFSRYYDVAEEDVPAFVNEIAQQMENT